MKLTPCYLFWLIIIYILCLSNNGCMSISSSRNVVQASNTAVFNKKTIAILPAKMSSMFTNESILSLRIEVNKILSPTLQAKIPSANVVNIDVVTNRLNQSNNLDTFDKLMSNFELTGVIDKQQLNILNHVLNCDFLLISRINSEVMDLGFLSKGATATIEVMLVNFVTGEISWAGHGEWSKGGMFGQGGAGFDELARNIVDGAFESLHASNSSGKISSTIPVQSANIKEMQQKLIDLGYQPGPVDGISGNKTINALKKFQQDYGLPVTGKADKETMNKLFQRTGSAKDTYHTPSTPKTTNSTPQAKSFKNSQNVESIPSLGKSVPSSPIGTQTERNPSAEAESPKKPEPPTVASPTDL